MPILVGTDGTRKMSKTYGNYVGVTDPPEEMFGKLMSIPDEAMGEYYRLLLSEAARPRGATRPRRSASWRGALVERFHDAEKAAGAEARFDQVHVQRRAPRGPRGGGRPRGRAQRGGPPARADSPSTSGSAAARRAGCIEQGGVRIAGRVVDAGILDVPAAELDGEVLQVGKRRHARVRVAGGA